MLADMTIFQSRYSQFSCTTKYRVIHQSGPVIYNPVDTGMFKPDGPRMEFSRRQVHVAVVSWSTNPKKGTWRISRLAEENPDVDFIVCGRSEWHHHH